MSHSVTATVDDYLMRAQMDEEALRRLVLRSLHRCGDAEVWSDRSGAVLYSGLGAIRPGPVYLMGINPGDEETPDPEAAIASHLAAPFGTNSYADECWVCPTPYTCVHCENGRLRATARSVFQKRVCSLFEMLGAQPENVPSTNLIFARSSEFSTLRGRKSEWKRRCWGVHRTLLGIVRPSWIITLGFGEAFTSLRSFGTEIELQVPLPVLQGGERASAWYKRVSLPLTDGPLDVGVLGVAHPGRRGFARSGLAGATVYPEAIRQFIQQRVLAR